MSPGRGRRGVGPRSAVRGRGPPYLTSLQLTVAKLRSVPPRPTLAAAHRGLWHPRSTAQTPAIHATGGQGSQLSACWSPREGTPGQARGPRFLRTPGEGCWIRSLPPRPPTLPSELGSWRSLGRAAATWHPKAHAACGRNRPAGGGQRSGGLTSAPGSCPAGCGYTGAAWTSWTGA